jgi:uncharacterized protein (TIGR02569 family)
VTTPPSAVLRAFGCTVVPEPLPGGQGTAHRAGDIVLKPVLDEEEARWCADVLDAVDERGFRVARPVAAVSGAWVVAGWSAWRVIEGRREPGRWADIVTAADAFHAAVATIERPSFLDRRTHRWAVADRAAWDEAEVDVPEPLVPLHRRLRALSEPLDLASQASQVVHGDLAGNVLFAPGLAPAIIDFSPFWRPPRYGAAVVAVDALTWEGADPSVLDVVGGAADALQLLVRAASFRLLVSGIAWADDRKRLTAEVASTEPVVAALEARAR